jgi:hypothetical protein
LCCCTSSQHATRLAKYVRKWGKIGRTRTRLLFCSVSAGRQNVSRIKFTSPQPSSTRDSALAESARDIKDTAYTNLLVLASLLSSRHIVWMHPLSKSHQSYRRTRVDRLSCTVPRGGGACSTSRRTARQLLQGLRCPVGHAWTG